MIHSVEIEGLRGIRKGCVADLTALTILVGPNGCGKSTILDALLLGATPIFGKALEKVAWRRRNVARGARWLFWKGEELSQASILVIGEEGEGRSCTILNKHQNSSTNLVIDVELRKYEEPRVSLTHRFSMIFEYAARKDSRSIQYDLLPIFIKGVADISLVELGSSSTQIPLHSLYAKAVEQGRRTLAKEILKSVVPGLLDIEILTDANKPVLYLVFEEYGIPTGLAGDGIQTLLRTCLELASRPGGVVLMEEPELHQHPAAIFQSAKAIFAAVRRRIQVILTTHSLELIDALVAEANTDEELAMLSVVRLKLEEDGQLKTSRIEGKDVAFARSVIGDDLR